MKKLFDRVDKLVNSGGHASSAGSLVGKVVVVGPHSVRVESLLGEGGLATVYRASDVVGTTADPSAMVFALKHMRLANAEAVRDMADEARTLAKLRGHPHILKLVATAFAGPEGAETDGFMLLEYCPGTLLELLQRSGGSGVGLDELTVYSVFSEISRAVGHMHSQSPPLAHRDLKAENVLRTADGRWVLADFGSATSRAQVYNTPLEISEEEEAIRRNTTPAYRAPEMWDLWSRQRIDTKVDIWALGVLLYVLLFGKLPFQDAKLAILNGRFDIPATSCRSPSMCDLVRFMLVTDPLHRPDIVAVIRRLETEVKPALTAGLLGGAAPPTIQQQQQPLSAAGPPPSTAFASPPIAASSPPVHSRLRPPEDSLMTVSAPPIPARAPPPPASPALVVPAGYSPSGISAGPRYTTAADPAAIGAPPAPQGHLIDVNVDSPDLSSRQDPTWTPAPPAAVTDPVPPTRISVQPPSAPNIDVFPETFSSPRGDGVSAAPAPPPVAPTSLGQPLASFSSSDTHWGDRPAFAPESPAWAEPAAAAHYSAPPGSTPTASAAIVAPISTATAASLASFPMSFGDEDGDWDRNPEEATVAAKPPSRPAPDRQPPRPSAPAAAVPPATAPPATSSPRAPSQATLPSRRPPLFVPQSAGGSLSATLPSPSASTVSHVAGGAGAGAAETAGHPNGPIPTAVNIGESGVPPASEVIEVLRAHISTLMSNHHAMSERIHTLEATVAHQNSLIQKIVAEQDRI